MDAPSSPSLDARLGSSVVADLEAVKNDLDQARELSCEYQRQLSEKSNDLATLRQQFEKTRLDLLRLHEGISKLREERHRLANEAMRAPALEMKLEKMTAERDRLQSEVDALRKIRAGESDARLSQLTQERDRLLQEVQKLRGEPGISVKFEEADENNIVVLPTAQVSGGWTRRRTR